MKKLSPINLDVDYPIPIHPTWDVWDSTKIVDAMRCMRRLFFSRVLGWQTEHDAQDLVFGQAWHLGMDYLYKNGLHADNIPEAMRIFTNHYREKFDEYTDLDFGAKTPGVAERRMHSYLISKQRDEWKLMTVPDSNGVSQPLVEVAGTVPVRDDWRLTFRLDKVMSNAEGHVIVRDHKTAKRDTEVERLSWGGRT
ncbi:MAG: PD-(D/E)XK nuclease family protein, partial [Candidatus Thorarchaeota archaeon]